MYTHIHLVYAGLATIFLLVLAYMVYWNVTSKKKLK